MWQPYHNQSLGTDVSLNGEKEQEAEEADQQGQWQVTDQQVTYPHELSTYPEEEYNQYSSPNFQSSTCHNKDFCASSTSSASQDYQELDYEAQESAIAASLLYEYMNPRPLASLPSRSSPLKSSPLQKSPLKQSQLKISPLKPSGTPKPSQKPGVKKRMYRVFDTQQLSYLERRYEEDKYLQKGTALKFANNLKVNEEQVKCWFNNRRNRRKKKRRKKKIS